MQNPATPRNVIVLKSSPTLLSLSVSLSPCAVSLISVFVCFFCVPVAVFSFLFFFSASRCNLLAPTPAPPHTHTHRDTVALLYTYIPAFKKYQAGRRLAAPLAGRHTDIYLQTVLCRYVLYVIQFQPPPPFGLRKREAVHPPPGGAMVE